MQHVRNRAPSAAAPARGGGCVAAALLEPLERRVLLHDGHGGLFARYYDNADFTNLAATRIDETVNFDWGTGSPAANIGPDTFSVRWIGQITPEFSESYLFTADTDDGVRLWVDGVLVIDRLTDGSGSDSSAPVSLAAGRAYDIRMDYFEGTGAAAARLRWESPSVIRQVVPGHHLTPVEIEAPPLPPAFLLATPAGPHEVNLSWDDNVAGVSSYEVEVSTDGVNFTPVAQTPANQPSYRDDGLAAATRYLYRVRSVNAAGESDWSPVQEVITTAVEPPAAPVQLTVAATTQPDGKPKIALNWFPSSFDETSWEIERSGDGGKTFRPLPPLGPGRRNFTDSTVVAGRQYAYRVRAVNEAGPSPWTNVAEATAPAATPKPTTLRIDAGGGPTGYRDSAGRFWSGDRGFAGGTASRSPFAVAGTVDDRLHYTRRWGQFSYSLPVTNGRYTLKLYFTDPLYTKGGKRKFNVTAEGARVLTNFDVAANGGGRARIVRSFNITVRDGRLNVAFSRVLETPILNALELVPRA